MNNSYVVNAFTLIDQNVNLCKLASFFRYFFRFISAYLILAFTVQRLLVICFPLKIFLKSKRLAWKSVCLILLIGFISNSVIPFLFDLNKTNESDLVITIYCDIIKSVKLEYLLLNSIYIFTIIIIPSLVIFVSNCLIIYKTNKQERLRNILMESSKYQKTNSSKVTNKSSLNLKPIISIQKSFSFTTKKNKNSFVEDQLWIKKSDTEIICGKQAKAHTKLKPFYWTAEQISKGNNKKFNRSTKKLLTMMLLTISFSFIALNIPHFIVWFIYFYKSAFQLFDPISIETLFGILQITEIFFLLNYSIKFLLCLTFSIFRNEVKKLGKFFLNIHF